MAGEPSIEPFIPSTDTNSVTGYKLKKIYIWTSESKLPTEYQEVEYIQSSGTQYIDTLHNHGTNTKFEIKFAFQTMTTEWNALCGARTNYMSNDDMDFFVHYRNSAYTMRYGCGGSMNDTWVSVSLDTPYIATLTKDAATLGGTTTSLSTNLTSCSYNDWVFGVCNSGTQVDNLVKAKVYYFKIWDNDVLVRDFVPCYRKSDNVIGMYDLVNDVFYTNNGSGTFTKGADIPGMVERQVRPAIVPPAAYEISYDLKGGNLSDLQAAGFDGVWTSGSYTFASDGLQQTGTQNDRVVYVIKKGLDLTNAKKLTAWHIGKWQYASWSNGKEIKLCTDITTSSNDITLINPKRDTYFTYSNNKGYRNSELPYVNASGTSTVLARGIATSTNGADDTITLTIDFENKTIEWKVTGTNNYTLSANLTDEQYNATRNMTAIYWGWGRGFHTYDSYERLKEVHLKIEY